MNTDRPLKESLHSFLRWKNRYEEPQLSFPEHANDYRFMSRSTRRSRAAREG